MDWVGLFIPTLNSLTVLSRTPGARDKRWVSEIDLSQPRHEILLFGYATMGQ